MSAAQDFFYLSKTCHECTTGYTLLLTKCALPVSKLRETKPWLVSSPTWKAMGLILWQIATASPLFRDSASSVPGIALSTEFVGTCHWPDWSSCHVCEKSKNVHGCMKNFVNRAVIQTLHAGLQRIPLHQTLIKKCTHHVLDWNNCYLCHKPMHRTVFISLCSMLQPISHPIGFFVCSAVVFWGRLFDCFGTVLYLAARFLNFAEGLILSL